MISFDFEYYKPGSVDEAVYLFQQAQAQGKQPLYYSGGTEIISMARLFQLYTGAVIDIKGIPECKALQFEQDRLVIGAAITLTALEQQKLFPLLAATVRDTIDHTNRNKITVGGNLCGKFIYREALLPFLLADSQVMLANAGGIRQVSIHQILNGQPRLEKGDLLLQIITDAAYLQMPFFTLKRTKLEKIDYPIVRIAALKWRDGVRVAASGVSAIPFRSLQVEQALNDFSLPLEERVEQAVELWPAPILHDILASREYRKFVLRSTLHKAMETLEGVGG